MRTAGALSLIPSKGPAGTKVGVLGEGLPASTVLNLVWTTNVCRWSVTGDQAQEYHGRKCDPKEVPLQEVSTDNRGALSASFVAPDDFGFAHNVLLVDSAGAIRNKALFDMSVEVSVTPTSGPVGTPITIVVKGMGVDALENNRQILYDNGYTGWMSAITTHGTATAVIPAVGSPGVHVISIDRGAFTFPYLNPAQSPRPDIPMFQSTFTVTAGAPVLPAPLAQQNPTARPAAGVQPSPEGAVLSSSLASGPVGTGIVLTGRGFRPAADVHLRWFRIVGNRVGGQGWEERGIDLPGAHTAADGSFEARFAVPGDVGGPHRIEASTDGSKPSQASFTVTPAASALEPASGPVGTSFTVHLTGVGWTETANIYTVVYDNRYIGYACGFNSQGDVKVPLQAVGAPGPHFVDLYPAIYKGEEVKGQETFRIPQLTFAQDHPGEQLPAFHFAFQITG